MTTLSFEPSGIICSASILAVSGFRIVGRFEPSRTFENASFQVAIGGRFKNGIPVGLSASISTTSTSGVFLGLGNILLPFLSSFSSSAAARISCFVLRFLLLRVGLRASLSASASSSAFVLRFLLVLTDSPSNIMRGLVDEKGIEASAISDSIVGGADVSWPPEVRTEEVVAVAVA